ncbi:hypothetical protein LCGC14_1587530 [marine sediment metagenome]|uniref:Uncharacterized protein n=1 Tax=marine sediment metagenome TaxID=412755 RepID=A0A0F9LFC4_9ZZZZ
MARNAEGDEIPVAIISLDAITMMNLQSLARSWYSTILATISRPFANRWGHHLAELIAILPQAALPTGGSAASPSATHALRRAIFGVNRRLFTGKTGVLMSSIPALCGQVAFAFLGGLWFLCLFCSRQMVAVKGAILGTSASPNKASESELSFAGEAREGSRCRHLPVTSRGIAGMRAIDVHCTPTVLVADATEAPRLAGRCHVSIISETKL